MADPIELTDDDELDQIELLVNIAENTKGITRDRIKMPSFLGEANLKTKEIFPDWEDFTGDDSERLKSITRKITAIKLLTPSERKATFSLGGEISESKDLVKAKDMIECYKEEITDTINYLKRSVSDSSRSYIVAAVVADAG